MKPSFSSSTRPLQSASYAVFDYTELELERARSLELGKAAHQQGEQLLEDTEGSHDKVLEDLAKSNEKDSLQMPLQQDEIEEGSTAQVSPCNALTHAALARLGGGNESGPRQRQGAGPGGFKVGLSEVRGTPRPPSRCPRWPESP